MTLYLYCVADPTLEPPAGLRGLAGAPVYSVQALDTVAWASDLPEDAGPATPELARAHDLVVRAALAIETPLPARFGQTFADERALRRSLDERSAGLTRALARVRGAVEMTLRILLEEPMLGTWEVLPAPSVMTAGTSGATGADQGEGSGRAYMHWLRDRQRASATAIARADFLQARVARAVPELVREAEVSPPAPTARSLRIAHLVGRDDIERYRVAVRAMAALEPPIRLMVSGPWAPYSFAGVTGD